MASETSQKLFAVVPLLSCPHIDQISAVPEKGLDVQSKCGQCPNTGENWVCLKCYEVNCSRFVEGHAVTHYETANHPIALSYADVSVWCYTCNAYLDNNAFASAIKAARESKFGQDEQSLTVTGIL
ncbi:Histone deacetylase 6 [Globodera pallida]|uniref:UBP-type domain-containing protein n=1 Tax=Globodera pallida TaxID=36090 RepID=A0A183C385_GLOPA|nr:Histone deacetylase 6 [Globodera pallida]